VVPNWTLPIPSDTGRTLTERVTKKLEAARDVVDPPTPVRLLITGAMLAACVYLGVHFVRELFEAQIITVNHAIYPLLTVGALVVNLLDVGWMSKKNRAKLERRRAEAARWRETIAAHNARVAALAPPPGPAVEPRPPTRAPS
jgi:hypothetical protein